MKKLKKSVKVLLISGVSVLCTLAIVLGCVFGLKKGDPTNGQPQGYELTASQKVLMNAINANASYEAKNNSQVIKEFNQDKYVDENGLKFALEDVSVFEDKYFVSTDTLKQKYVYFYPKNGETKSTTLLKSLQTQYPESYNCSSLTILYAKDDYICFSYKEGENGKYYEHYEMAYVYTQDHIEIVQDYKFELDYLGRMNYLGKYTNLYTTFSNDFYIFEFQTANGSEVLFETYTYQPTKNATLKTVTDNFVVASDFFNDLNSSGGFYILNDGVVYAYSDKSGVMKKFTFVENSNYYYDYKVTAAGLFIEEMSITTKADAAFKILEGNNEIFVKCSYKFLSFEDGKVSNIKLDSGFVKATAISVAGYDGFGLFVQQADQDLALKDAGKMIYLDGNLKEILKYNAISIEDLVFSSNGVNFLTNSGLYSTKKSLVAEPIVDFVSNGYSLASKSNDNTFAANTKRGIFVFDFDGNKLFDKAFNSVTAYDSGYYYAASASKHYILNTRKPNQPIHIENFSDELSMLIELGYGLYLTESKGTSEKTYSFYDYTGKPVIENVAYSNISLGYNSDLNYSDLNITSKNGEEKVFVKQNTMILSNQLISQINNDPVPFASGSGSDNLSDGFTSSFLAIDYDATAKTLDIRRTNGKYPKSGKVMFTPSDIASGGTLVVGSELYFTFNALPRPMSNHELIVSVSTNGITSPTSTGGFYIPSGFDTGVGYVSFDLSNILDVYTTTREIVEGVCYASFEFYYQDEDEIYSSNTNTDSNMANYAHAESDDLEIYSLSDDYEITFSEVQNKVIGSVLDTFYAKFANGDQYMLDVYNSEYGETGLYTGNFDTSDYIYRNYADDRAYINQTYTFYAYYEPITYKIAYNLEGGEFIDSQPTTARYSNSFGVDYPERYGYHFDGWVVYDMDSNPHYIGNLDESCGTQDMVFTAASMFKNLHATHDATVTFKATWEPIYYYVEFDANGGSFDEDINKMNSASDIVRFYKGYGNDYRYKKSYSNEAYVAYAYNSYTDTSGPILLSRTQAGAKYEFFDEYGTSHQSTETFSIVLEGQTWYYSSDEFWVPGNYLDTLGNNKLKLTGSLLSTIATNLYWARTPSYGYVLDFSSVGQIAMPERTGYEISSYYVEGMSSDTNHQFGSIIDVLDVTTLSTTTRIYDDSIIYFKNLYNYHKPENTVLFTFSWSSITYNLSYDYDGGSLPSGSTNPSTANYGSSFSVVTPVKTGYSFNGWKITDRSGNIIENQIYTSTFINLSHVDGDTVTLTALWSDVAYNVSIDYSGGFSDGMFGKYSITTTGILYYDTVKKISKANNQQAFIAGVIYNNSFVGLIALGYTSEAVTLVTTTVSNGATQTHVSDSYFYAPNGDIIYYSSPEALIPAAAVGESDIPELKNCIINPSITYVAVSNSLEQAAIDTYNYYASNITVSFTESFTIEAPTKHGYTFTGWTITGAIGGTVTECFDTSYSQMQNIKGSTVYFDATWSAISYDIVYDLDGGSETGSLPTKAYVDSMFAVVPPKKLGHVFSGWKVTGINTDALKYGDERYTYELDASDLSEYMFVANNIEGDPPSTVDPFFFYNLRKTAGSVNLIALWDTIYYSIEYDLNDTGDAVHSGYKPTSATYNQIIYVSKPTRVGFEFLGWTFSGLSDKCEHIYYREDISNMPVNFTSTNGNYYDSTNVSALKIVNATEFSHLRCEEGKVTFTAVWRANLFTVTYHYLPSNFDALTKSATTINTLSEMTETKSQIIQYGKPFVSLIPTSAGTGDNEVPSPDGVSLVYWAFSTSTDFSTYSATKTADGFTAISGTKLYAAGSENVYDYQPQNVHAYAVYEFPEITLKFYIPNAAGAGNNLANYVYAGTALDAMVSYGSTYVVKNSVTVDNATFLGWMVSSNHYIAGSLSKDSVTTFEYNSTSYTMTKGNTVTWGYSNTDVYDVNHPVYYLYAVYSYQPQISVALVEEEPGLINIDYDIVNLVDKCLFNTILNDDN